MNHTEMLVSLARLLPYRKIYLELGVQTGATFEQVAPFFERAVGVDIEAPPGIPGEFYRGSTEAFFAAPPSGLIDVDLVFIDADHSAGQVFRDALNALRIVRPLAGLVVLHDTYPASAKELAAEFCGDAWKAAVQLQRQTWIECVTLPGCHGLTICRQLINGQHLHWWPDAKSESV